MSHPALRWTALAGLVVTLGACAERHGAGAPPAHSTARPEETAPPVDPDVQATREAVPPEKDPFAWRVAVRMERWEEADRLLSELPEKERSEPKLRFLRARVANEVGNHAAAIGLLEGLERELPLLADEVREAWASAAAEVGPHAEAAAYFARKGRAADLLHAARALHKGSDERAARAMTDRAVTAAQKSRRVDLEAEARGLRAFALVVAGKVPEALGDLQWLAEKAPATAEGRRALALLDEHKKPLTGKRKLASIDAMIDAGYADMAVEAVQTLDGVSAPERLHATAWALYRARKYPEAAAAFAKAATARSGRTAEQVYYQARALERMGDAAGAMKKHDEVVKRFQKGLWADRASYQRARLLLQTGQFQDAVQAFTAYLARFPTGQNAADARYDLALAELSAGAADKAEKSLGALGDRAKKRDVGTLRELEAVAAYRAGHEVRAVELWNEVARTQPLTWGAMMSRARLKSVGASEGPLMQPVRHAAPAPIELALPPKTALLLSIGLDGDAEETLARAEQAAAQRYVGRESEALCGMYGLMNRARRQYKVGVAALSFDALMQTPSGPERWGWECVYPRPYSSMVDVLTAEHALPVGLVHAVMRQESAFKPEVVSPVGAAGLMQLMPSTAKLAASEADIPFDDAHIHRPDTNLRLGAYYLGKLLKTFQGSVPLAVASYNAGPTAVSRWLESGTELEADLWVARIPYDETRAYVGRVMGNLVRYQWLAGGDEGVLEIPLPLPADARAPADAY